VPNNGHGGRRWTLRGRRCPRPPPAETTNAPAKQEETRSPLTDSNRRPPPYHERREGVDSRGIRLNDPASGFSRIAAFRRVSRRRATLVRPADVCTRRRAYGATSTLIDSRSFIAR